MGGLAFPSFLEKPLSLKNVEHALCEYDKYFRPSERSSVQEQELEGRGHLRHLQKIFRSYQRNKDILLVVWDRLPQEVQEGLDGQMPQRGESPALLVGNGRLRGPEKTLRLKNTTRKTS